MAETTIENFQFVPSNGNVMIVSSTSAIEGWSAVTGHTIWSTEALHASMLEGVLMDQTSPNLYSYNGTMIVCRNVFDGELIWTHEVSNRSINPILVSVNSQYVYITQQFESSSKSFKTQTSVLEKGTGAENPRQSLRESSFTLSQKASAIEVVCRETLPGLVWKLDTQALGFSSPMSQEFVTLGTNSAFDSFTVQCARAKDKEVLVVQFQKQQTSSWAEVYNLNHSRDRVIDQYHIPSIKSASVFSLTETEGTIHIVRISVDGWIEVWSSVSHGKLQAFQVAGIDSSGTLGPINAQVMQNQTSGAIMTRALVVVDSALCLWRDPKQMWVREEGLGHTQKVLLVELPDSVDPRVNLVVSNLLERFVKRVARHLHSLRQGFFRDPSYAEKRDQFGLKQYAIAFDDRGNVWAIDTLDLNNIIWKQRNAEVGTFVDAWVESHTADTELTTRSPQVVLSLKTANGLKSQVFDALTGESRVLSDAELPQIHGKGKFVRATGNSIEMMDKLMDETGLWTFSVPIGYQIAAVSTPEVSHVIASIGRVLGNRSVLYKYLTGSFITVAATDDSTSTLGIWVLDAETGFLLHHELHLHVVTARPIKLMQAENWFVCHYWTASDTNAYQITVTELYQGLENTHNTDKGNLHVSSQSYIFDHEVMHMTATTTRQGITSRDVVLVMRSGALLTISRKVLDPRRPDTLKLSTEHKEELLMPYEPVIDVDPKDVLSHRMELLGIEKIVSGPTLLESTSLLCAYGLDIFITRVTPSMPFDILSESFSKGQIGISLVLLCAAIAFTRPMSARKVLDRRWIG